MYFTTCPTVRAFSLRSRVSHRGVLRSPDRQGAPIFFERPAATTAAVLDFLGLPAFDGAVFDQHNARPRSPMAGDLAARLDDHFRPYDDRLAAWLGRVPGWRR